MKFGMAKTLTVSLLLAGLAIGCAGMFLLEKGSSMYLMTEGLMVVLFIAGITIAAVFGRCPNCGKRLVYQLLKWKKCPKCGKTLDPNKRYIPVHHL